MANSDSTSWGCDVPVSMPEPVEDFAATAEMGSHVFTPRGLRINANLATLQETYAPTYAPPQEI
jgi:hypothetical protein